MVQFLTKLKLIDNSGAKLLKCIKVLGGHKKRVSKVGDIIVTSVKKSSPNSKVQRGTVTRALVTNSRRDIYRLNGFHLNFNKNGAIIINQQFLPVGSRFTSPLAGEIRQINYSKIIALSKKVI